MKILIQNVHSACNLGDHGIMSGTLNGLRNVYPHAKITVAANDPQSWLSFPEISVVSALCSWVADCKLGNWRGSLIRTPFYLLLLVLYAIVYRLLGAKWMPGKSERKALLRAYYEADLVLSCGGGNFYAEHSMSPSFFWNLVSLAFPLALGKKVFMLPQSIGPVQGRIHLWLSQLIMRQITVLMVREPMSFAYVHEKIGHHRQVILLPDLAFCMPPLHNTILDKEEPGDIVQPLQIGVTLINRGAQLKQFARQSLYEDAVVEAFSQLSQVYEAVFYIFVQSYGPAPSQDDTEVSRRVYERLCRLVPKVYLIDDLSDSMTAKAMYSRMDGMVATRMHTSIFALTNNVPVISIGYQPKSKGMVEFFGMENYFCDIQTITTASLHKLLCQLVENRDTLAKQLQERNNQIRPYLNEWTRLLPRS